MDAREISAIQPLLAEHNTKLIGVGIEQFGVSEFINGNFFNGDVFVDQGPPEKETYATLNFKTMSFREMFQATLSVAAHCITVYGSIWECMRVGGNVSGDKYQLGGCLIVEAGGGDKPLLHWTQQGPLDHVANADILRALGIDGKATAVARITKKISEIKTSSAYF